MFCDHIAPLFASDVCIHSLRDFFLLILTRVCPYVARKNLESCRLMVSGSTSNSYIAQLCMHLELLKSLLLNKTSDLCLIWQSSHLC